MMRGITLVGLLACGACTNAGLEPIPPPAEGRADNKLRVEGRFCTTDPDDLEFPVKLLFVIDESSSMDATDPDAQRTTALLDVIDLVFDIPGVEIGILGFGLGVTPHTERCDDYATRTNCRPGFAPPEEAILSALETAEAAGTTDFLGTLNSVIAFLADDMGQQDPLALQSARYSIIFLSDGLPDADGSFDPVGTCTDAAEWERAGKKILNAGVVSAVGELLEQIVELADQYDVRELTFNTAFAAAPQTQAAIKACGGTFMRAMAKQGGGIFRDFSSGEAINFLFVDFTSFKRLFAMKSFLAANLNAAPFSRAFGVDVSVRSDDPTLAIGIIDSDADGIPDEQERLLGTDPFHYDTDNDGFGDGVELLFGMNPGINDTLFDVDFDGVRNDNELRAHSRVDFDDVIELSEHAYRYKIQEDGIQGSSLCYRFSVDNISLASTAGARAADDGVAARGLLGGAMQSSENRILFEVTEAPFDAPSERGVARIACARARFDAAQELKQPANGIMTLPESAFVEASVFDPEVHCVDP